MRPLVRGVSRRAEAGFVDPRLKEQIEYWDASLAETGWFAGKAFSAADIIMSFPLEAAANRAGAGEYPNVKDFLGRIHARPAYLTALRKGGPYAYA